MDFTQVIILQLIAHIIYDYFLQNDLWVRHRNRFKFRSQFLYRHTLIVFIVSWIFSMQWGFFVCSLVIAFSHFFFDGFKSRIAKIKIGRNKTLDKSYFFIDQLIHLTIIFLCVVTFNNLWEIEPIFTIPFGSKFICLILGYLLCLKPANVFIREIFRINNLRVISQPGEDLLNAGKLIGNIERILTLTLLLLGKYEVVGFIVAGKSILRYEGVKTSKTEYVLIGTLLSFGIAIILSIFLSNFLRL
jgi:hypothetical protein